MSQSSSGYRLSPTTTNGFGVASLIVGIAGFCTVGVGGLAAIVLGFLGIRKSRETHTGKGLSIAGIIIGIASILVWLVFGSAILAMVGLGKGLGTAAMKQLAEPPRSAIETFLRDLSGNNVSGAVNDAGIPPEDVTKLHEQIKDLGLVQKVDFDTYNSSNGDYFLQGVATFERGQKHYTAHVSDAGGTYRVTSMAITP